jgi:hypothetical protein
MLGAYGREQWCCRPAQEQPYSPEQRGWSSQQRKRSHKEKCRTCEWMKTSLNPPLDAYSVYNPDGSQRSKLAVSRGRHYTHLRQAQIAPPVECDVERQGALFRERNYTPSGRGVKERAL